MGDSPNLGQGAHLLSMVFPRSAPNVSEIDTPSASQRPGCDGMAYAGLDQALQ